MERVLAISVGRRRDGLAEIAFASGETLRISTTRLAGLGLAARDEVDERRVAELRHAASLDHAMVRLLRLVGVRARSRAELERRLESWGVAGEDRRHLLDRLTESGVIDDGAFAREVSDSLQRRGQGSLRASYDLQRLGVDQRRAAAAVADHAVSDPDVATEVVRHRFGPAPYDTATLRRAAGLLARRGFDEDVIAAVLRLDDEI